MEKMGRRIVILGGGIAGCTAALLAARAGFSPILVESRSFLGYEMNGRYQMFMEEKGWESYQKNGVLHLNGTVCGKEVCFFQGETKAGLMKQIMAAKIPCFLFSHLGGIICDQNRRVEGIVLANSYGTWYLPTHLILDCSGNGVVRRVCEGKDSCGGKTKAAWVMELDGLQTAEETLQLRKNGEWEATVYFHRSRRKKETRMVHFEMSLEEKNVADGFERSRLENIVRCRASQILGMLRDHFKEQTINLLNMSSETAVWTDETAGNKDCQIKGCFENPRPLRFLFHAVDLLRMQAELQKTIEQISEESAAPTRAERETYLYRNGKREALTDENWRMEKEPYCVWKTMLWPVKLNWEKTPEIHVPVVVAGLGTAGVSTLQGLGDQESIGIEMQYVLGGTRTAGHVINYYCGRIGGYTEELEEELLRFHREILHTPKQSEKKCGYLNLALLHHYQVVEKQRKLLMGSTVCDVVMEGKKMKGVIAVNEYGTLRICADVVIDTTGNGDVAVLAGADYEVGDPVDGFCQTYSQWGVEEVEPEDFHQRKYVGDYDTVDASDYADLLRASICAQTDNSPYYSSNPVSFREGRRILGEDYLTLGTAIANREIREPVTVAVSTLDNHGRISADIARMGFCAVEKTYKIAVPMGCFLPKGISGMLVGGKAVSVDRDTLSLVRMSADIQNAGYGLGIIGKVMVEHPGDRPDYEEIRKQLTHKNLLPKDFLQPSIPNTERVVEKLTDQDAFRLRDVLLQDRREVLPLLRERYRQCNDRKKKLLLAKALAWFHDGEGKTVLLERMEWLKEHERRDLNSDIDPHYDSVRHGISGNLNDYWEMNQLIELAGRISDPEMIGLLCEIIGESSAGGPPHVSRYPYYGARRDMICIPFFERIYNLAHVFVENPRPEARLPLMKLLEREYIGGKYFAHSLEDKPLFLSSYLELYVAIAAYRCKAEEVEPLLEAYAMDIRRNFAKLARKSLGR